MPRCGPIQPTDLPDGAGGTAFLRVPEGAVTMTVYGPFNVAVSLAWVESRTPSNLTSNFITSLLGASPRVNVPAGAKYLRVSTGAPARIWVGWADT